jgi:hypothetical protein
METEHEKAVKLHEAYPKLSQRIEEIVLSGDLSDAIVKLKATVYDTISQLKDCLY